MKNIHNSIGHMNRYHWNRYKLISELLKKYLKFLICVGFQKVLILGIKWENFSWFCLDLINEQAIQNTYF